MNNLAGQVSVSLCNLQSEIRDLLRRTEAANRDFFGEGFQFFFGEAVVHFGVNHTASDGIDCNAAWSKFFCQGFCK